MLVDMNRCGFSTPEFPGEKTHRAPDGTGLEAHHHDGEPILILPFQPIACASERR